MFRYKHHCVTVAYSVLQSHAVQVRSLGAVGYPTQGCVSALCDVCTTTKLPRMHFSKYFIIIK